MRKPSTYLVLCALVWSCAFSAYAADDPSDQFLDAYMAVQQAEKLELNGKFRSALSKYKFAATTLDQIRDRAPDWKPAIVDYRRKKTGDAIISLEAKVAQGGGSVEIEEPLPGNLEPPLPRKELDGTGVAGGSSASLSDLVAQRERQMQQQLKEAKSELQTARREKEDLAEKLDKTIKQLSQTRINEAEIKSKLAQAQESLSSAKSDNSAEFAGKKALEVEITRLKDALRTAQIDRDAAEDQALLYSNRTATVKNAALALAKKEVEKDLTDAHKKIDQIGKERDTAVRERDVAVQEKEQFAAKLGGAQQQIAALTKERDESQRAAREVEARLSATTEQIDAYQQERDAATTQAQELTNKLGDMQQQMFALSRDRNDAKKDSVKLAAQFEEVQKQVATITSERDNARKASQEAAQKFSEAQKQVALLGKQRDESEKAGDKLAERLAEAEKKVASVTEDRNAIARQRDDALAQVAKMKDAQKRVDQLLADNSSLTQRLSVAEQSIKEFNAAMPKKDEQIAALKKEVGTVKDQLDSARQQNKDFQISIADLQSQLDSAGSELDQMKTQGVNPEERRRVVEENDLLRNIVLRELKETAKRAQAKKLVMAELQHQEVQSNVLLKQIEYLAEPAIKLSEKEKALFKQPQISISNTDDATVFATAAAKRETPEEPAAATPASTNAATPTPAPVIAKATPAVVATATPAPEKQQPKPTPMQVASLTTPVPTLPKSTPASIGQVKSDTSDLPKKDAGSSGMTPKVEAGFTPTVPDELLPQAREAKDFFDRGNYREAEKTYEKMLSKAPNNVYILSNLGVVRFRAGKLKLAEEAFRKAIAIEPNDWFSHCTLGIVLYSGGRDDDAINELTKSLAINPKNATAHNYLAIAAARKGWYEAAQKEEETAIALDTNYADAHFNLSVIFATGQPPNKEQARKHYERALKLGAEADAALEQMIK